MSKPFAGLLVAGMFVGTVAPAFAQEYTRHSFTVSTGAGDPRADLRPWFSTSPLVGVEYGYRFHRNFQVDGGFDAVFGAADIRDFLPTAFGDLRIRDRQYFVPFGGRVILPLADERVHIYGGLGGAYMRYAESIQQPFQDGSFKVPCSVCATRDGFGYYGIAGLNFSFDRARMFRFGAGTRVYRGYTSGDALGATPAGETNDRWLNVFGSFSFTF
jgi:hypothetical protein